MAASNRSSKTSLPGPPRPVHDEKLLDELQKKAFDQLATAASMLTSISMSNADIYQAIAAMNAANNIIPAGGSAGVTFGGPTGYNNPIMPGNQNQRPAGANGGGAYPGGHGYGMGGILGVAQATAANWIHNRSGTTQGGATQYQALPNGTFQPMDAGRNAIGSPISSSEYTRRVAVSAAASKFGNASGVGGMIRAVPGAEKALGVAAIPAALWGVGAFVGHQRSANAAYESIYGPGTDGFTQRAQNMTGRIHNSWSNVVHGLDSVPGVGWAAGKLGFNSAGGLSDSDYNAAFKGISAMGYQGSQRSSMLGFTTKNFNQQGLSVQDSLQLLQINSQATSSSLGDLTAALKAVGDMAQQVGQSSQVAVQSFTQSYGASVSAGFGGASASVAQGQVGASAGLGRQFAGVNTSSMYGSTNARQLLATRMGYSNALSFDVAVSKNPTLLAEAQDKQLAQSGFDAIPSNVVAQVQKAIAAAPGGARAVATDEGGGMAAAGVVQQVAGILGPYMFTIMAALQASGITGMENNEMAACTYYVKYLARGSQMFVAQSKQAQAALNQQGAGSAATKSAVSAQKSMAGVIGSSAASKANLALYGSGKNAVYDPVIAKLQAAGVQSVTVETSSGPQLVSLASAAANYRDQLVNGTAIVGAGGPAGDEGQTVGSTFGMEQNTHYANTTKSKGVKGAILSSKQLKALGKDGIDASALTASEEALLKAGMSQSLLKSATIAAVKKAQQEAASGISGGKAGSITVGLSQDAINAGLTVNTTGSTLVNNGAANNLPPAIPSGGSSTGK